MMFRNQSSSLVLTLSEREAGRKSTYCYGVSFLPAKLQNFHFHPLLPLLACRPLSTFLATKIVYKIPSDKGSLYLLQIKYILLFNYSAITYKFSPLGPCLCCHTDGCASAFPVVPSSQGAAVTKSVHYGWPYTDFFHQSKRPYIFITQS